MRDADVCDPADASTCSAGRPLVVSRANIDGTTTVQGLCAVPCLGAVNPARTASVDALLARFDRQGCAFTDCPCPTPEMWPATCLPPGTCTGIAPQP